MPLVRSQPCPLADSSDERLSDTEEVAGSTRLRPCLVAVAQPGRAPVRNAGRRRFEPCRSHRVLALAGGTSRFPQTASTLSASRTSATPWLRSSTGRAPGSYLGTVQVRRPPRPPGRTAMGAVSRLENGWASGPWGSTPLLPSRRHGRAGKAAHCYRAGDSVARRFESCCLRSVPVWSSWSCARLLTARRRFETCRRSCMSPRGRTGDDAGFSTRKLRVRTPPGLVSGRETAPRRFREPETAGSTPADQTLRGGGALPREPHELRRGFESHPRYFQGM